MEILGQHHCEGHSFTHDLMYVELQAESLGTGAQFPHALKKIKSLKKKPKRNSDSSGM